MEELIFGSLIVWVLGRIAKKKADQPPGTIAPPPSSTPDTTPAVVPFTAANVNAYKNLNTTSIFDNRLAKQARRVTPDGTGKNIVDGSYKCFAPGSAQRVPPLKRYTRIWSAFGSALPTLLASAARKLVRICAKRTTSELFWSLNIMCFAKSGGRTLHKDRKRPHKLFHQTQRPSSSAACSKSFFLLFFFHYL
jgi:hypothetical protein